MKFIWMAAICGMLAGPVSAQDAEKEAKPYRETLLGLINEARFERDVKDHSHNRFFKAQGVIFLPPRDDYFFGLIFIQVFSSPGSCAPER